MLVIIQSKIFCLPVSYKKLKVRIYKTLSLPVVLYGCETWSLTLREEQRLRVSERKILRPKREEDGSRRKLHSDELHRLYYSPNTVSLITSRRIRWAGHVARTGEMWGVCKILVRRPEGRRPLGRSRRRWADNIKTDLGGIKIDGANWIRLAQDRVR
jgi:hypothetical protein